MTTIPPKTFREACRRLTEIPHLNAGGCGVAALALARWRKAHEMKVSGYALLYDRYDRWELDHNQIVIDLGAYDEIEVPSHVAVQVGKRLYDSNGGRAHKTAGTCHSQYINEQALLAAINKGSWNPDFDRSRHIPTIQDRLGVDLSDVWTNYAGNGYYQPSTEQLKG